MQSKSQVGTVKANQKLNFVVKSGSHYKGSKKTASAGPRKRFKSEESDIYEGEHERDTSKIVLQQAYAPNGGSVMSLASAQEKDY